MMPIPGAAAKSEGHPVVMIPFLCREGIKAWQLVGKPRKIERQLDREVPMGNQRGEIIIGFMVVMMVAMMTMMFVGMPMMHGSHHQGGADQKNGRGDDHCTEVLQQTNERVKQQPPAPRQERPSLAP
jgi:hypothetical protein